MIEIFTTDINNELKTVSVCKTLRQKFSGLKINFDSDETGLPYPCGHTILRVEGKIVPVQEIMQKIQELGFQCEILTDKICSKKQSV